MPAYPQTRAERDRWIEKLRPPAAAVDEKRPHGFLLEQEPDPSGRMVDGLCVFLTNRECPWRCVMCDLWRHTLPSPTRQGAIPAQIDHVLAELKQIRSTSGAPGQIKLYNSGSFFDSAAIPISDHELIAQRLQSFQRVIVECHPALISERVLRFRDRLSGQLEVAMGLETVHPEVLPRLNKGMTLEQFHQAARFLQGHGIALRVFVLIQPPWNTDPAEAIDWSRRSAEFAFDCAATVVSLIPTRPGNGALEVLASQGLFVPPTLRTIEKATEQTLALGRGRVFVDLWELDQFSSCITCFATRRDRLRQMNDRQAVPAPAAFPCCSPA